jgi:plastocyanin
MTGPPTISRREFIRAGGTGAMVAASTGLAVGQETTTHTVEMTDQLVFDPAELTIAPGDTVIWENVGSIGHSVTAYEDATPADAAYFASGGFDSETAARNNYSVGDAGSGDVVGGETYQHTFEGEGTYEYFCIPHEGAGMVGTIQVGETDQGDGAGGSGFAIPPVPDAARALAVMVTVTLLSVLGLAYVFLKYGGDYAGVDDTEQGSESDTRR